MSMSEWKKPEARGGEDPLRSEKYMITFLWGDVREMAWAFFDRKDREWDLADGFPIARRFVLAWWSVTQPTIYEGD